MTGNRHHVQQQEEQKPKQEISQQRQKDKVESCQCPNCGAVHVSSDKFCPECGMAIRSHECARCGATTEPDWEICPQCGQNLHAECCSFCGAKTDRGDTFCPECGNSKKGIICPNCKTLNFRSFCRKCNTPLNTLAQEALQQIRQKPKWKEALAIAKELAELEELLSQTGDEETQQGEIQELSEENREFVNQYKELLAVFRGQKYEEKTETPKPTTSETKPRKQFSLNISNKEEAQAQYNAKLEEMKNRLNSLFPDTEMTPQMQRNYYTAVKIEIIKKIKVNVKIGWKCNAYGCVHDKPNDCAKPFMGGEWIYKEVERETQVWVKQ